MVAMLERNNAALTGWGLLMLRLAIGLVFIMHGGQKVFVKGIPGVADFLGKLGMQPPAFWAYLLTVAEIAGGIALIVGLFTRFAALALGVTMVVAIATVLWTKGFFLPGYEFALTLLAAALALAFTGPGRYAIDTKVGLDTA